MVLQSLIGYEYSILALRIAAIIIVTKQNSMIENLDSEIGEEVNQIISKLKELPDNLGTVLAWEICGIC